MSGTPRRCYWRAGRLRLIRAPVATALIAIAWTSILSAQTPAPFPARMLDTFEQIAPWQPGASDGVRASIHPADGMNGHALRLDFDLAGTAGYALAARTLPLDLPANYEIAFDLRADAPSNNFQVKLVDASGENVWWFNRPNFEFPHEWQHIRIKKRQIDFAWGPTKDRVLTHAARIEFVVAAGRGGGAGSLWVSRLELRERPPEPASWAAPVVGASSYVVGAEPLSIVDGNLGTAWKSDPAQGSEQSVTLDFGQPREFGGLVLRWQEPAFASRYDVQFSDDGTQWQTVRSVNGARGGPDALLLPEAETRYVRLALHDGPQHAYALS
jgi:hypothetical protein